MKRIFSWNPVVLVSLFLSVKCAFAVPNQQISFDRNVIDGQMVYDYHWFDHQDIHRHIRFALDMEKLKALPLHQSNYVPDVALGYIKNDLMKYAQTLDPRKARVDIRQHQGRLSTQFRGTDPELLSKLKTEFKQREDKAFPGVSGRPLL